MNVTIINPTAQSNLRIYPADAGLPTASNLNWLPGQSATPNKVDVKLSPSGQIKMFNQNGTVDVLADVVGYYTNSTLKELASGLADANAKIAALEVAGRYAKVDADSDGATLIRGNGVASVSRIGMGTFKVTFTESIDQCGWFATSNDNDAGLSVSGQISIERNSSTDPNALQIRTYNHIGSPEDPAPDDGFSVHVVC